MSFRAKTAFNRLKRDGGYMSDHIFQEAYARVRARHDDKTWFALAPREITDLIYREIRVMDRERRERNSSRMAGVSPS